MRPYLRLQLPRRSEEKPVRVDLGGVRTHGRVTQWEICDDVDPRGCGMPRARELRGLCEPFREWAGLAGGENRFVQSAQPGEGKIGVVIQFGDLPGLTQFRPARLTRQPHCREGRGMGAQVIGMRVAAVFVIGGHHLGPKFADLGHERAVDIRIRGPGKTIGGQLHIRVALGESGIHKAEENVLNAEDSSGCCHFFPA